MSGHGAAAAMNEPALRHGAAPAPAAEHEQPGGAFAWRSQPFLRATTSGAAEAALLSIQMKCDSVPLREQPSTIPRRFFNERDDTMQPKDPR
jgi:hypothetical protein